MGGALMGDDPYAEAVAAGYTYFVLITKGVARERKKWLTERGYDHTVSVVKKSVMLYGFRDTNHAHEFKTKFI